MTIYEIFTLGLSASFSVLGWFSKQMWEAVKELRKDLSDLKSTLPKEYILKGDFSDFKNELFSTLHRIENKLDGKQDK